ncbi:dynein light chain Tctex-type protein 2 isoform X4 [Mus musculus]|uniref:dynein light chain Tctex-type protein 2 isoform X4 n=1 Tax=Mus musculus TaxID=10090 RepID=UPI0011AE95FE|nr:dynein light chain Tctex-type protein 2 isoform X4 [Mus musculus]
MAVALAGRGARGGRGRPPGGRAEGAGPGRRAARATAAAKTTETGGAGADDSGRARGGAVPAAVRQRPGLPRSAVPKGSCRAGLRTSGFGGSSMHWPRLASNPVSTSRVLGLQMCTTMLGIFSAGD